VGETDTNHILFKGRDLSKLQRTKVLPEGLICHTQLSRCRECVKGVSILKWNLFPHDM